MLPSLFLLGNHASLGVLSIRKQSFQWFGGGVCRLRMIPVNNRQKFMGLRGKTSKTSKTTSSSLTFTHLSRTVIIVLGVKR